MTKELITEISKDILPSVCDEDILTKHIGKNLKVFKLSVENSFRIIRGLIRSDNKDPLIIHKLKSTIGMLGYISLQEQCIIVEKAILEDRLTNEEWNQFRALCVIFLSSVIDIEFFSYLLTDTNAEKKQCLEQPTIEDIPFLRNLFIFASDYDGSSLDFISKNGYKDKDWFLDIVQTLVDCNFELAKNKIIDLISQIEGVYEKK